MLYKYPWTWLFLWPYTRIFLWDKYSAVGSPGHKTNANLILLSTSALLSRKKTWGYILTQIIEASHPFPFLPVLDTTHLSDFCSSDGYCISLPWCGNTPAKMEWFKTTLIYLTILKIRNPKLVLPGLKSRCQQGSIPFWRLKGRICFLAFSCLWRLLPFLGSWTLSPFSKSVTYDLQISLSFCLSYFLLIKTLVIPDNSG